MKKSNRCPVCKGKGYLARLPSNYPPRRAEHYNADCTACLGTGKAKPAKSDFWTQEEIDKAKLTAEEMKKFFGEYSGVTPIVKP